MDAAFLWALAATFAAGIQVFSQKIVAHERRDSALNGIFGYGISGVIAAIVFVLVFDLPTQWLTILLISASAGLVHGLGSYIRIESLKHIDTVIYFPINKVLGPILVVLVGVWWFGDNLSLHQYIGIALSLSVPLLLVSSAEKHRQGNLGLGVTLLVISTVLTALTSPFIKGALEYDATILFTVMCSQFAGTTASLIVYVWMKRHEGNFHVLHTRDIQLGIVNGVLQFISFASFVKALSLGLVSIVYVIHAHYILIPIVLSVWWYKEHVNARKLVAIVVSSLAITLLA